MTRIALAAAALLLPACMVYDSDRDGPPPGNSAPYVSFADAGCYWDPYYPDYVWWFEADVDDYDGPGDVESVWASVYDDYTGQIVDEFELYPDVGITWYSAWQGRSTYLDCAYLGYVVDVTAYDWAGAYDVVSVVPEQLY